jgi:hypothetical protein
MAARKKRELDELTRKKIKTSQLINRLTDHALADQPVMDASQVQAVRILLNKCIPDMKAVEVSGDPENPIETKLTIKLD